MVIVSTSVDAQAYPVVATLFYKSANHSHGSLHPDSTLHSPQDKLPQATLESLTDGAVPTDNLNNYPLEPPTPGPDPLDNLYGAYISPTCLAHFYQTLAAIVPNFQADAALSRPLDKAGWSRITESKFIVPATVTLESLRRSEEVSRFEREWNVEVIFQRESVHRRYKRLAVFDMDSTLIQQEVIDEIARELGVEAQVSAITAAAMNGELDFEASLRKRCALLTGVSSDVWETLKPRISLTPGARELTRSLKRLGYKMAVLSGGFTPLAGWLASQLGLDYFHANHLVVSEDGQTLTGALEGDIVHAERKRALVLSIAEKEGVLLDQVLVVGDGANDLPMMGVAGLGVAFNAKPKVQMVAPARLNSPNLADVLYLLGLTKEDQEELLQ